MKTRGFTLPEVMIAVAILAMIGVLVFGTFTRAMQARDRAQEITEYYHEIRQAMLRMSREISMAFISYNRSCDDPQTKTLFASASSSHGMRLNFTSFSHVKMKVDANESDQNELSYFVDNHPDNPKQTVLIRREQHRIDNEPDKGGNEQVLADNITSIEFAFYDPINKRWRDDWDTNKSDDRTKLPRFVTITLKAVDPRGQEETFVTKTTIFLTKRLLMSSTLQSTQCIE